MGGLPDPKPLHPELQGTCWAVPPLLKVGVSAKPNTTAGILGTGALGCGVQPLCTPAQGAAEDPCHHTSPQSKYKGFCSFLVQNAQNYLQPARDRRRAGRHPAPLCSSLEQLEQLCPSPGGTKWLEVARMEGHVPGSLASWPAWRRRGHAECVVWPETRSGP